MTESQIQPKAGAPYAIGAREYLNRGWSSPLPVPYGSKRITASGWTGYKGQIPDLAQVKQWITHNGTDNIAIRMPENVVGIDVDVYGEKFGDLTLDVWEMTIGPLPATWRSTSRHDSDISGIWWFRLPPEAAGLHWHDLGGDVETISWHHRYAVVWPSIHPETGQTYAWYDENMRRVAQPPRAADLALLPPGWIQRLLKPSHEDRSSVTRDTSGHRDPAHGVRSDAAAWIDHSLQTLDDLPQPWYPGAFWDQTTFNVACDLVRLANSGWTGYTLDRAEEDLHAHAPTDEEWTRHEVDAKWRSALIAVGDEARPDPLLSEFEVISDEERSGSLFDATPILRHIKQAAHNRLVAAPMLLMNVLARVLLEAPPGWMLPATVGSQASLNLGFAVVGESSGGKTASLSVSSDLLGLVGVEQGRQEQGIGSGEGLIDAFLDYENKIDGVPQLVPNPSRLFTSDEVETMNSLLDRNGSTLSGILKSAMTGGILDTPNAKSGGRNRRVSKNVYRLVMVVGIQPEKAGQLLEGENSGLPQRFLWVDAKDPDLPRLESDTPEWPGALDWVFPGDGTPERTVDYPEEIKREIRQARLDEQHNDESDRMAGHLNLIRLKVAAALAFLHGETDITEEWWTLAGRFTHESLKVINRCRKTIQIKAAEENIRRAKAAGQAQVVATEIVQQNARLREKCRSRVVEILQNSDGEVAWSHLTRQLSKRQKEVAEQVRDSLEIDGVIEVTQGQRQGSERIHLTGE